MQFRHPEQLDRQRFHHELSDSGRLGRVHPGEDPTMPLLIVALLALAALASIVSQGVSLTPLFLIAGSFTAFLLLASLRPR